MKKLFLSLCAMALFAATQAQTLDRSIRPQPGPAPAINLKEPATFTLPNGLKVFVVENHKMPIVTYSIQLDIRPELQGDKVGVQDFTGELLTRGTINRTKDQFDNATDDIGASIGASGSSIYGVALSKFQGQLLDLMSDALMHPAFNQEQLDKVVKQTKSGLISSENDADNMLSNVSGVVNFGKNHPYGEVMTLQTIQNVSLNDCQHYYQTYFHPNVAYLAVVGDITPTEAKELVTKYFGNWQKADVPKSTYPKVSTPSQTSVDFVNRPGAVQSSIAITYPVDLQIGSPEVIKSSAMNQILGGGSSGRLFQNLREKHGWTYGSYSSVSPDDIIGSVEVYAKCRNIVTDSSITEMLKEMDSVRNYPVPQTTLNGVKNYLSGIFALRLESPQTIASYAINIDRFHMPKDYYKNYLKNVAAVTPADVQAMAQKYILPQNAHIVVVGNTSEVDKLKKFSAGEKINYYDAYGNSVEPVENKVVNGKKIEDVLNMYINAIGGKTAIEGLKDLTEYGDIKMGGVVMMKLTEMVVSPDKYLQQVYQPSSGQAQKIIVNGEKGTMQMGNKKKDLPDEYLTTYKSEADLQSILHPEKFGISYSLVDMGDVNGTSTYIVSKVSNNGKDKALLYIDAQTGLMLKKTENELQGGQSVLSNRFYSNYQEVKNSNGYKIPFNISIKSAQGDQDIEIRSAKANSGIKESKFN